MYAASPCVYQVRQNARFRCYPSAARGSSTSWLPWCSPTETLSRELSTRVLRIRCCLILRPSTMLNTCTAVRACTSAPSFHIAADDGRPEHMPRTLQDYSSALYSSPQHPVEDAFMDTRHRTACSRWRHLFRELGVGRAICGGLNACHELGQLTATESLRSPCSLHH